MYMRAIIQLTEQQKKELQTKKKTEKSHKIQRRYMYVELSNSGMTNLNIASIIGVTNDTLTDWKDIFEEGGLEGLSSLNYAGRRESKLDKVKDKIIKKVNTDAVSTLKELQSYIFEQFNISIEQSWLSRYCKKNSISLTKKQD